MVYFGHAVSRDPTGRLKIIESLINFLHYFSSSLI